MTSTLPETDYAESYEDTSAWCHACTSKPAIDRASNTSPSGVQVLRVGTAWDCPACESRWIVARIEEVGVRWMTTGVPQ
jgi:hypothetical protein